MEAVQEHRQKIGRTNHTLLLDIKSDYGLETPYQGLERSFTGYVANVTETCDPENALPLITQVQVAAQPCGLAEALPDLKERTGVKTMLTDGGYGGILSDAALQEQGVKLIQSAIRVSSNFSLLIAASCRGVTGYSLSFIGGKCGWRALAGGLQSRGWGSLFQQNPSPNEIQ